MRDNEERVAAVKQRVARMERQRRRRRVCLLEAGAGAACLAVIAALAAVMPGVMAEADTNYTGYALAAGIFGNSAGLGYVVVGLAAFVLGSAFTFLCVRLHRRTEERDD